MVGVDVYPPAGLISPPEKCRAEVAHGSGWVTRNGWSFPKIPEERPVRSEKHAPFAVGLKC